MYKLIAVHIKTSKTALKMNVTEDCYFRLLISTTFMSNHLNCNFANMTYLWDELCLFFRWKRLKAFCYKKEGVF